eukprot:scaffold23052_cov38-Prasinocladus_malaysianus.AAC.3
MLKPVEKCWQPQDFLPDPSSDTFLDEVAELRKRTSQLPDDYLVVLAGGTPLDPLASNESQPCLVHSPVDG